MILYYYLGDFHMSIKRQIKRKSKSKIKRSRPTREARKAHNAKVKAAQKELREQQEKQGIIPPTEKNSSPYSNGLSGLKTEAEEEAARQDAVAAQLGLLRNRLPILLRQLSKIEDPRNPKKSKHKLTVILLYGLLCFVFQMASRREANREMSLPAFLAALQDMFPELETLPHADTLNRLLEKIDPKQLEDAHLELVRRFMRGKKFQRFLISKCYPIAVDGTQKFARDGQWQDIEWLERRRKNADGDEHVQQYVYVLEANLVFHNGLTIPLMSEFLSYAEGDPDDHKQDCELKALKRLAARLKAAFPRLAVMLLLDGLYPNGPVMTMCHEYGWQYMIVLPDKCLPSAWNKYNSLKSKQKNNSRQFIFRGRKQTFCWVNDIDYRYDNGRKHVAAHVVVCEETWEEVDSNSAEIVTKHARHAWISSEPLSYQNVLERCNQGARYRWGIENSMQVEKHYGYHYEHVFSYNWNAMRGFHCLMRMAHMFNAIALHTKRVRALVKPLGIQAFLKFVRDSLVGRWLSSDWRKAFVNMPFQLQIE